MRAGPEFAFMEEAALAGRTAGDGPFTKRCEAVLQEILGGSRVLLTTSGTHALELSALLLDLGEGDEVCMPSFTFVSTANAFLLRGARPVFCDIDPDTLNLDPASLASRLTERTRAVVPVHYGGVACAMDEIGALASASDLAVVEDNAHGLFGTYRGRPLGTLGGLAALSFHETKNLSCGEGGALIVNEERLEGRAEILREKGTDRSRFFRGEVDKYTWQDLGSSYVLADLLAAWLFAQLEAREGIQAARKRIWTSYRDGLAAWASAHDVRLPHVPDDCTPAWHLFHLILPTQAARDALIAHLDERGIHAVFHYLPLHLSPVGRVLGGKPGDCPVTESISGRLVRLPFFGDLGEEEQASVIDAVCAFRP